jgi:ABC-2 type transport system permease protein
MNRALARIAVFEYLRHLRQRRFLAATFGLPLFIALIAALSFAVARRAERVSERPWAVVAAAALPGAPRTLADAPAAATALATGEISGFVVLEAGGRVTGQGVGPPPEALRDALAERALAGVLAEAPANRRALLARPAVLRYQPLEADAGPALTGPELARTFGLAFGLPFLFALAVIFSTSYLVMAITEEKENRLMEILATSVSPSALVGGKVVGLGLLSLTQTGVWLIAAVIGLALLLKLPPAALFGPLPLGWYLTTVPYFLVGYLLYAVLMVGVGVAIGQPREAQQVAGFLSALLMLPFVLMSLILFRPNSPAALAMSLFPLTASVAMPMRSALHAAPPWQLALGWLVLAGCAAIGVQLVGRIYRAAMLLYGARIDRAGLWRAITG